MVHRALGVVWLHYLHARVGEQGSFESHLVYACTTEASIFLIKATILQTLGVGRKLPHTENCPFSVVLLEWEMKTAFFLKSILRYFIIVHWLCTLIVAFLLV